MAAAAHARGSLSRRAFLGARPDGAELNAPGGTAVGLASLQANVYLTHIKAPFSMPDAETGGSISGGDTMRFWRARGLCVRDPATDSCMYLGLLGHCCG